MEFYQDLSCELTGMRSPLEGGTLDSELFWYITLHSPTSYTLLNLFLQNCLPLLQMNPTEVLFSFCFSLVAQSCTALCNPMDYSMPGFPVLHCLPEFAQTHVHWFHDGIQLSHPLPPPSAPALNLSHQGLFQWVSSSHHMVKVSELQLQHQSVVHWIFRTDLL